MPTITIVVVHLFYISLLYCFKERTEITWLTCGNFIWKWGSHKRQKSSNLCIDILQKIYVIQNHWKFVTKTKVSWPVVGVAATQMFMDLCTPFIRQGEFHNLQICAHNFQNFYLWFSIKYSDIWRAWIIAFSSGSLQISCSLSKIYLSNPMVFLSC